MSDSRHRYIPASTTTTQAGTSVTAGQDELTGQIRITDRHWDRLVDHLLGGDIEQSAFLVCGVQRHDDQVTFLVRDFVDVSDANYLSRGDYHLSVAPSTIARHTKRARLEGTTLILCHSHPFPGRVAASAIDLSTEAELCGRVLPARTKLPSAALVIGPDGLDGRTWAGTGPGPLTRVTVIGAHMRHLGISSHGLDRKPPDDQPTTPPSPEPPEGQEPRHRHLPQPDDDGATSRQALLWGAAGQAVLRDAHVVVVGCGGTGSHVVTQLAHLRVGRLTLIDHDSVETSNLSRLLGVTPADVGSPKVTVLARFAAAINPDLSVTALQASILDVDPKAYTDADVIVCATDGHGSRSLLCEVATQYLIPVVDLGVEVDPIPSAFRAGGGVRVLRPGDGCLLCAQTLSPALIREEYLDPDQRAFEAARGYLRGVDEPAPSVVALNGVVASLAVLEVCQLLVGMLGEGRARVLYRSEQRTMTTAGLASRAGCHVCSRDGVLGLGDARPLPTRWRGSAAS